MTNYENIRNMSLKEMATFLVAIANSGDITEYCEWCSKECERRQECDQIGECVEEMNDEDIAECFLLQECPKQ